jgi:hypothetical protein
MSWAAPRERRGSLIVAIAEIRASILHNSVIRAMTIDMGQNKVCFHGLSLATERRLSATRVGEA